MKLQNKVAVITGAARAIGEAAAQVMAAEGARLVLVDTGEEEVRRVAEAIGAEEKVLALTCEMKDYNKVQEMVKRVIDKFGQIDILVNNAAATREAMSYNMTAEEWQQVIEANLTGAFYVTRAIIPYMREKKYGKIVNVSSTAAYGDIGQVNYAAAQAGILGMTRTLALELGRENITVNAVLTGLTSDYAASIPESVLEELYRGIPLKRASEPAEQARVISFLASDDASYVTGAVIPVSGGSLMI